MLCFVNSFEHIKDTDTNGGVCPYKCPIYRL